MSRAKLRARVFALFVVASGSACFAPAVHSTGGATDAAETEGASDPSDAEEGGTTDGPGGTGPNTSMPTSGGTTDGPTTAPDSEVTTDPTAPTSDDPTSGDPDESGSGSGSSESSPSGSGSESGPCIPDCGDAVCGDDPVCATECGSCDGDAVCASDGTYCGLPLGYFDDLGDVGSLSSGVIVGHRVTVPADTNLRRFGIIAGEGGNARLALYTDAGGPQNLVAETGEVALAAGVNEIDVPATAIDQGVYWMAIQLEQATDLRRTSDPIYEIFFLVSSYDEGYPAVMSNDDTVSDFRFNLYIVVED